MDDGKNIIRNQLCLYMKWILQMSHAKLRKKWWSMIHLGCVNIEEQALKCVFIKFESYGWTWQSIPICAIIGLRHIILYIFFLLIYNINNTEKFNDPFMKIIQRVLNLSKIYMINGSKHDQFVCNQLI
jgi:uncharacterized protein YjfI (DUF2170 family)